MWRRAAKVATLPPEKKDSFGVYIHVPFCVTRCGYCDFNTYTPRELGVRDDAPSPVLQYLDAVERELSRAAERYRLPPADTVFVGGEHHPWWGQRG